MVVRWKRIFVNGGRVEFSVVKKILHNKSLCAALLYFTKDIKMVVKFPESNNGTNIEGYF